MAKSYFRSLKFKIAAGFAAIFLCISFVLNLLLYTTLSKSLEIAFQSNILLEANGVLVQLRDDYLQIPVTNADQPIQIWLGSSGSATKFYERTDFPDGYDDLLPLVIDQFYTQENKNKFTIESDSLTFGFVRNPSETAPDSDIIVVLSKNNREHKEQLSALKNRIILSTTSACLISLALSLLFAQISLKPINLLIEKAKSIKPSTKMDRLPESKTGDELSQLSQTFNQMIDRIEEGIQNQSRFFNSASHELRTPLANMQAELELELDNLKKKKAESTLRSIQQEVTRMQLIVSDFLMLAQLEAESISTSKETLRIDDLIYDMIDKTKYMRDNSGATLKLKIDHRIESFKFLGDKAKMESLFSNLLINAYKFGDNSESISMNLHSGEGSLTLSIVNNISRKNQQMKGNGLGLWLCKKISEIHGFHLSTKQSSDRFSVELTIPTNAHNSQH